jgi:hypothetical protein
MSLSRGLFILAYALSAEVAIDMDLITALASRRELLARISDWEDDRLEIDLNLRANCALSGLERAAIFGSSAEGVARAQVRLPRTLGSDPGVVLDESLAKNPGTLARVAPLSAEELRALSRLLRHRAQREGAVDSALECAKSELEFGRLAMKVAERLFDERIAYHQERAHGFIGLFRADQERCAADRLQSRRDEELVEAGRRLVALYEFLEQQGQD